MEGNDVRGNNCEGCGLVAEVKLLRSHITETLAAMAWTYGEGSTGLATSES
jgi:hypothetical protein